MWRLIYFIPIWLIFIIIRTTLIALGWILIPIAALLEAYEPYIGKDGAGNTRFQYRFTWPFMWPWDNKEDGIADGTYWRAPNLALQIIYWSAFRNPVNNLRYTPILSTKYDIKHLRYIGSFGSSLEAASLYDKPYPHWFLSWQGPYSGLYIQWEIKNSLWRFWIGWKLYPDALVKIPTYQINGVGFATQFKRVKKYDT